MEVDTDKTTLSSTSDIESREKYRQVTYAGSVVQAVIPLTGTLQNVKTAWMMPSDWVRQRLWLIVVTGETHLTQPM